VIPLRNALDTPADRDKTNRVVKPIGETRALQSSEATERIRKAAFRRLAQEGYANLSMRDIAREAGVNHALINYYYGSKDRLVIAVLDELNERLLERQQHMYASDAGFADKWQRACEFYEDDLASGFVRVQMELWAASLSNPGLRKEFLPRVLRWRKLIEKEVREAVEHYELKLPFASEAIACFIVDFWVGMEFEMLLGVEEKLSHHRAALDAFKSLLERLDRTRARPRKPRSQPARRKAGNGRRK
jgi:AcrR family transcriptional regulator